MGMGAGTSPASLDPPPPRAHRSDPMSDLFAPYHALTPPGRLVVMACGVIYPHSLTPAQPAKVLTRARFRHGHDPIRDNQYRASCDDLIAAGIIHDAGFRGKLIATGYWASLRDLLVKAIRFGEQPEIRAHLTTVVGQALDRDRLRGLMHDHALVQDAMDTSRLHAVREEMERADARRLTAPLHRVVLPGGLQAPRWGHPAAGARAGFRADRPGVREAGIRRREPGAGDRQTPLHRGEGPGGGGAEDHGYPERDSVLPEQTGRLRPGHRGVFWKTGGTEFITCGSRSSGSRILGRRASTTTSRTCWRGRGSRREGAGC